MIFMKRIIAFIISTIMIFAFAPLSIFAEEPSARMRENLVAHWDFEGETVEQALADKATGGTVADNLIEYYPDKDKEGITSPIVIERGTAYIPKDTGIYLAANNSTDLHSLNEYTLFARFSMAGTPTGWMDFVFKNGFIRAFINHTGDAGNGDYAIEFRQNGSASYTVHLPKTAAIVSDSMVSIVLTGKMGEENSITMRAYVSTDGQNYFASEEMHFTGLPNTFAGANSSTGSGSIFALGKASGAATGRNMSFVFDDVRLYKIALTADEIATIKFEQSGSSDAPDAVLLAQWKFDEIRGNTVTDSVGGKTAELKNASFEAGIKGNGVRIDTAKNGMIDFGEKGITSLVEGKSKYSVSMWIMPSYYLGAATSRLFTMGADKNGNALLDVNWGKNNVSSLSRKGISVAGRAEHNDKGFLRSVQYTLEDSVIPNLSYMGNDTSRTFGVWQLLTVNVDLQKGECTTYINDKMVIQESFSTSVSTLTPGNAVLLSDTIGYSLAAANTTAFNGVVDDFRVYDGLLNDAQIADMLKSNKDTTSPTADQKLVDALIERLGGAAVLYRGSSSVLLNGRIAKLDYEDYSLTTVFKNRTNVYVPKAFALSYFGLDEVETDEDGYVELNALCATQGYELYYSFSEKLAIITPKDVASFSGDDTSLGGYTNLEYRTRIIAFFENALYTEPTTNTETTRKVIYTSEEIGKFVGAPSICTLNGVIYNTAQGSFGTKLYASSDGGETWRLVATMGMISHATIFAYNNELYMLGLVATTADDSIGICKSRSITEEKVSFSAPSSIHCEFIDKSGHCGATPVLFANGRVYKAFEDSNIWAADENEYGPKKAFVVSCDLNDNLANGANWVVSNYITITSEWTMEQIGTTSTAHHGTPALEGNMVQAPDGTIYDILRLNCEPATGYAVCLELSADGKTLSYPEENKVINFPGGDDLFYIYYDETTGYYLSLVNNNTAKYWPMQRNILSLSASKDLINWEIVDTILIDREMLNFDVSMAQHGFQYVTWCFDGDDILFTVREQSGDVDYSNGEYFHNCYTITFYRLSDYKSLLKYEPTDTNVTTEPNGTQDTFDETSEVKGGCRNVIGGSAFVCSALVCGAATVTLKKKRKS